MIIGYPPGYTRVIGRSQGYEGLPVRDASEYVPQVEAEVPSMTTLWHPSPAELATLNAGGAIEVKLLGSSHPPILLSTVAPEALGV